MKNVLLVVGTRPNFIKVTRFREFAEKNQVNLTIVHTGQHYDNNMSDSILEQLGIDIDVFLGCSSLSPVKLFSVLIDKLSDVLEQIKPELILVVGDVNSTLASALCAQKMGIKIGHIESGLRSEDRGMPEEINRILTDEITDYFFITEPSGQENLVKEGKPQDCLFFVGNSMIDSLVKSQNAINSLDLLNELNVTAKDYALVTMHRPSNVDTAIGCKRIIEVLNLALEKTKKIVFPIHPRTKSSLEKFDLFPIIEENKRIILTPPLGYFEFQHLIKNAHFVLTDSGGIQEETTYYQVPCVTIRENTERPITIEIGTNELSSTDTQEVSDKLEIVLRKKGSIPELWDGLAAKRIFEVIKGL